MEWLELPTGVDVRYNDSFPAEYINSPSEITIECKVWDDKFNARARRIGLIGVDEPYHPVYQIIECFSKHESRVMGRRFVLYPDKMAAIS